MEESAMLLTKTATKSYELSSVLVLSAWGFVIVIASFLFLYVGQWIDELLQTSPSFMLGFFMLAIMLCVGRLYQEAWQRKS
jgi:hypothetical protein